MMVFVVAERVTRVRRSTLVNPYCNWQWRRTRDDPLAGGCTVLVRAQTEGEAWHAWVRERRHLQSQSLTSR